MVQNMFILEVCFLNRAGVSSTSSFYRHVTVIQNISAASFLKYKICFTYRGILKFQARVPLKVLKNLTAYYSELFFRSLLL